MVYKDRCTFLKDIVPDGNLNVNLKKTKVLIFNCRFNSKYNFKYEGNLIEKCKSYRYLGVIITSSGKFKMCKED